MTETVYETECWGVVIRIRANWAEASSTIYADWHGDGEWQPTQYQVAAFSHRPEDAMREFLRQAAIESGDDPDDESEAIANAVECMA